MNSFEKRIITATRKKDYQEVEKLLRLDVNANCKDNGGRTPLQWASYIGDLRVVELLLDNKADIHGNASFGFSPLHLASYEGHFGVTKLLVQKGADLNDECITGQTAEELAREKGHLDIADYLFFSNPIKQFDIFLTSNPFEKLEGYQRGVMNFTDNVCKELPKIFHIANKIKEDVSSCNHTAAKKQSPEVEVEEISVQVNALNHLSLKREENDQIMSALKKTLHCVNKTSGKMTQLHQQREKRLNKELQEKNQQIIDLHQIIEKIKQEEMDLIHVKTLKTLQFMNQNIEKKLARLHQQRERKFYREMQEQNQQIKLLTNRIEMGREEKAPVYYQIQKVLRDMIQNIEKMSMIRQRRSQQLNKDLQQRTQLIHELQKSIKQIKHTEGKGFIASIFSHVNHSLFDKCNAVS